MLEAPVAHRGLHGLEEGIVENSLSAVQAAIEAGYGVEIDVQMSADGEAIVFHDETLERMTNGSGPIEALTAADISTLALNGATGSEAPPTLAQVLDLVERAGSASLFIEVKDRSGAFGPTDGRLEARVVELIAGRRAPIAVMSFNPYSVARLAAGAPQTPRGLVACAFNGIEDPARRAELAELAAFEAVDAQFVSYCWNDLPYEPVSRRRAAGVPILTWTIRTPAEAAQALAHSDQITFEGFRP